MSIYMAEFLGTMMLIWLGDGVVASVALNKSKGKDGGWIVVTAAWGLAVAIPAYIFGGISGAHMNPAVTIGNAIAGNFPWANVAGYITAQMLGGFVGAVLVWLTYLPHWKATEDKATKLGVFCTAPAIRDTKANFITEFLVTALLVFGLMGLGQVKMVDGFGALTAGALIFVLGLSLGGPTGYAINPARDLAPRIAHAILPIAGKGDSDWKYAWIPVLGPILGGILGALLFMLVF
ncbi:MIP/aquaporin family protein [Clostridium botulinum]|uniref:Aquaporin family protein n=3 Tax=Clostridium botulinum TaxID=1491 RepID=A0A0A2HJB8_CLOBO|nr:MIP/aquaporin family protein [Clostridium botulinum]AJD26669.1 MIP channel s family protein [Clostridium botulinum CDC_297]EPS49143.1 glycerol uptake facilitator protein [Clostridium botulinum A1 str. CFSAN002368]ACQ51790.1 glycerol uptake facilitator protein [Clostridium botulinum Ba4 str. 657]AJE13061.1 MIP channel s family protein [Clostridium botulinum CDC_1436]APR01040.1 MIP channel s family protein [Clostridium botulinum]